MQWFHSDSLESLLRICGAEELFTDLVVAGRTAGRWSWAAWSETNGLDDLSVFDLASLTKPFMATLALELDRSGRLSLGHRVADLWPEAPTCATLGDLLRHRSGLAAWLPVYHLAPADTVRAREIAPGARRDRLLSVLGEERWWRESQRVYSDLGYMLWGVLAEEALGEPLVQSWLRSPVGHPAVQFGGGAKVRTSPIGTAQELRLGEALGLSFEDLGPPGPCQVQDGNARSLGPTAHAGLFGSLKDVCEWLEQHWIDPLPWLRRSSLGDLTRPEMDGSWFRAVGSASCGSAVSALAFGHTGFVGGALWIDPPNGRAGVCLANRRSPTRSLEAFRARLFTELLGPRGDW